MGSRLHPCSSSSVVHKSCLSVLGIKNKVDTPSWDVFQKLPHAAQMGVKSFHSYRRDAQVTIKGQGTLVSSTVLSSINMADCSMLASPLA